MAWDDVHYAMEMPRRWRSPLQYSVLLEIARYYNPKFGYAWPSLATVGERFDRSPRRVNEAVVELEDLVLVIRLGPDYFDSNNQVITNRYVPIWRVENGVQQMLREAADSDAEAKVQGEGHAKSRMGPCEPSHGDHANPRMGAMRNLAWGPCEISHGILVLKGVLKTVQRVLIQPKPLRLRLRSFGSPPSLRKFAERLSRRSSASGTPSWRAPRRSMATSARS